MLGSDGDEPVAELPVRRVLGGIAGTCDDSVFLARDILSTVFCCRIVSEKMDEANRG